MTITINPRLHKNVSARVVIFQEGIFKVRCAVHSQDRRQLFVGEGFAQVRALYLANQDLPFRKENISVIEKEKNLQKDASF